MSTRIKLIGLVVLTSLAGSSSLLINNLMLRPVRLIESESALLDELRFRLVEYSGQVNRLDSELFRDQLQRVDTNGAALDQAFRDVENMVFLPSINPSIETSLETVVVFRGSIESTQKSVVDRSGAVLAAAGQIFSSESPFTILQLLWTDTSGNTVLAEKIRQSIFALDSSTGVLNVTVTQALTNLDTQKRIIEGEIRVFEKRARGVVLLVILLVTVIPLVLSVVIANLLALRIRKIDIGISRMKDGDLADRIDVKSRDEMGRLSRNVNDFTEELGRSILRIKDASGTNLAVKEELLTSVQRVSEATEKAGVSVRTIDEGMADLDSTVLSTTEAAKMVEERLSRLENVLQDQVSMIEETTASVTQMIASIGNVGDITKRKKVALGKLVQLASDGGDKLNGTNDVIARVHDSIEEIRSTTGLIASIASRTNLLAMNAAIEAAHAGDAGRGFAVVADEIRKLAEATGTNSKRIQGVMKGVIGNIEQAADAGRETGTVFRKIDEEVADATASFDEIAGSMEELNTGGNQILEAMARLNDISGQVQDDGEAMNEAAATNRQAMEHVTRISGVAARQVRDITSALETLEFEMKAVTDLSRKAESISATLEREVMVYKTENKPMR